MLRVESVLYYSVGCVFMNYNVKIEMECTNLIDIDDKIEFCVSGRDDSSRSGIYEIIILNRCVTLPLEYRYPRRTYAIRVTSNRSHTLREYYDLKIELV